MDGAVRGVDGLQTLEPRRLMSAALSESEPVSILSGMEADTHNPAIVEVLPTVQAEQLVNGLGFNIDPNRVWQLELAKQAGATEVRFQAGWDKIESYHDGSLGLDNLGSVLAEARRLDLEVLIVAAYGPPRIDLGRWRVAEDVPAGATHVRLEGGLSDVDALRAHIQRVDRQPLVGQGKEAYYGGLIHAVDVATGTVELASALSAPLRAGDELQINQLRYASAGTDSPDDPSVQAYARYVRHLAETVAAAGVEGRIEIWNEPPWTNDRWDTRGAFYDTPPAGVIGSSINAGFFNVLRGDQLPDGVRYNWGGTHKSGFNSLLGGNVGPVLTEDEWQSAFSSESFHPYGNNPEDAAYDTDVLLSGVHFSDAALPGTNADSNFKFARALALEQAQAEGWTLEQNITETGLTTGDAEQKARFNLRQYFTYQALGFERINFYRLVDGGGGYGFADRDGTVNQAYTALQGVVSDLSGLALNPVDGDAEPLVVDYAGEFPLTAVALPGRAGEAQVADSLALALWQRSYTEPDGSWKELESPEPGLVTLQLPYGYSLDAVRNVVTRADVAYSLDAATARLTLAVTDDPLLLILHPNDPDANLAPSAVLTGAAQGITGQSVVFDATGSTDADGAVAGYVWEFEDGVILTGSRVERAFDRPGEVTVSLTVYDDGGRSDQVTQTVSLTGPGGQDGQVVWSRYLGTGGSSVQDLLDSGRLQTDPNETQELDAFEAPEVTGVNYGATLQGYLVPRVTGTYHLHLAADDAASLRLSASASTDEAREVARVDRFVDPRDWDATPGQGSQALELVAGRAYYIEALHQQAGGGAHLAVGWSGPGLDGIELLDARFLSSVEPILMVGPPAPGPAPTPAPDPTPASAPAPTPDSTPVPTPAPAPGVQAPLIFPSASSLDLARLVAGQVVYEQYAALGGNDLTTLTGSPDFRLQPDHSAGLTQLEAPVNQGSQFGSRIWGVLTPRVSGVYRFHLAGDDQAELRLATGPTPSDFEAGEVLARVEAWTGFREWDKYNTQQSIPVYLEAGASYFIEASHKEGGGGDHLSVAWSGPESGTPEVIGAEFLAAWSEEATDPGTPDSTASIPPVAPTAPPAADPPVEDGVQGVSREVWGGLPGSSVDKLSPVLSARRTADRVELLDRFEVTAGREDAYGSRLSAVLTAPETGLYRFYLAADDAAQLFLGQAEGGDLLASDPIAEVRRWTNPREFTRDAEQVSQEVHLMAGQRYALAALHAEGSGGDHLAVAWTTPSNPELQVIGGDVLSTPVPADSPVLLERFDTSVYAAVAAGSPSAALSAMVQNRGLTAGLELERAPRNMASRLRAVWQPSATGPVQLTLAADDRAVLFVRQVGETAWRRAARVESWTDAHSFTLAAARMPLSVEAGVAYELELWHEQGGGPGHVSVGLRWDVGADFEPLGVDDLRAPLLG